MEKSFPYMFGELLAGYRRREGLRQEDLRKAVGVPRSYISEWECEVRVPQDPYEVNRLAQVLNLSIEEKTGFREAWTRALESGAKALQPKDGHEWRNKIKRRIKTSTGRIGILQGQLQDANDRRNNLPEAVISHHLRKAQIKVLAGFFGLLESRTTNPHLRYTAGDVSYWCEQGLSLYELALQFAARQVGLDAAERDAVRIADQGELSRIVAQVIPLLLAQEDEDEVNPL